MDVLYKTDLIESKKNLVWAQSKSEMMTEWKSQSV